MECSLVKRIVVWRDDALSREWPVDV